MSAERYDRIVLTGFMGSGKSTLGVLLAERLGWSFLDLDREIEHKAGRTVPQIFSEEGESAFRKAETAVLTKLLSRSHAVISLGGGAPESPVNHTLLAESPRTAVVYLAADFATLSSRCRAQAEEPGATARPNFADEALARERFMRRRPLYNSIATHIFDTAEQPQQACVERILDMLER